jgi:hypothetical protein
MCTSCHKGYYLAYADDFKSYGTCNLADIGAAALSDTAKTIYVTPQRPSPYSPQLISGELDDPFADLHDALNRAE